MPFYSKSYLSNTSADTDIFGGFFLLITVGYLKSSTKSSFESYSLPVVWRSSEFFFKSKVIFANSLAPFCPVSEMKGGCRNDLIGIEAWIKSKKL